MEEQENFSSPESLRLINEMIGKAKRSYVTKGIASIVWGTLIIVCSLGTWSEIVFNYHPPFDPWLLVFLALLPQLYFGVKERRTKNFKAHDEVVTGYIWTAFGIAIFIVSFYNAKYGNMESTTLFMMLYGIPTFITGGLGKFTPMIAGGIICWIFSIISLFTTPAVDLLLMAGCGLFAWLIPGIILWNKYQKQRRENV